ncbi:DUF3306 domain-containing protein [Herminiimonas contaminans]|uniref:DUF3306 domain-containing protein n=1 Tax=Herminiimonas contaminans TaxID=1111140 RepID=A0ABS0EYJ3_9BURK|nr:DUF3306 domain-containing protein [Herminiimonas contaminans]MBF8178937.1 DUF3306 domain-containing protein [Herminiimonas contaminans]
MAAEEFFARWAKKNAESAKASESLPDTDAGALVPESAASPDAAQEPQTLPTMDDVAKLTHDSDYSGFMAQGVDESVKRSAMKKLFTDPHFNIMDGLDVYIEDFNKFEPMTPAFIAGLSHAKGLMDPLAQLKSPLMKLLDMPQDEAKAETEQPVAEAIEQTDVQNAADEEVQDQSSEEAAESSDTKIKTTNTNREPNVSSHVDET